MTAVTDAQTQDPAAQHRRSDLKMVARGGALNLVGAIANGLFQFLLVVAVSQVLTRSQAGAFWEAVALFLILNNTCMLGADTGLTRMIPRYRVQNRIADIRASLDIGIGPALAAGIVFGVASFLLAQPLSELFTNYRSADASMVADYIRIMAVFLPIASAYMVAIAATRGFGTMLPTAVVDRIGKSGLQFIMVVAVVLVAETPQAIALAWSIPMAVALLITVIWLYWIVKGEEEKPHGRPEPPTPRKQLAFEFWKFTAPRGLTGIFQITILWVGTLMVGSMVSAAAASVYTASTRYLVVGSVVNQSIILVVAPKLAELLATGEQSRARDVYQVATAWLMMLAWPMYLMLTFFAPVLLKAFGHHYSGGTTSLEILSIAMVIATGIGPVDIVLLMGGKSSWNLFNVCVALALNVVISLLLIPHIGLTGAAVAWAASILFNNIAPLMEVRAFLKVDPFGRAFPVVAGCALLCFGGLGLLIRMTLGETIPALALYLVVASVIYAAMLLYFRERIELPLLWETVSKRPGWSKRRAATA